MTTAQRELQIVAGSAWLESCNGCGCPDCAAHRPRVLAKLMKLRGVELVELEAGFESETSLSFTKRRAT